MERFKGRLLYLIDENFGLLFINQAFYKLNIVTGQKVLLAHLPVGLIKSFFGRFRLVTRLLRLEPRCIGRLDERRFVVFISGQLWLLDLSNNSVNKLNHSRQGFNVLNVCECNGSLYWGDYGANPNHKVINVYKLDSGLNVSVVYSFPESCVRHIHNIIANEEGFVILTGDNEDKAGIYRVNSNWTDVRPWKIGEQKYRAVVGFSYKGGLLYATDSVETENHIREINNEGNERELFTLNGSCIYGGEIKGYYLFSTTVEPHEGHGYFCNKLGNGIKSWDVQIVAVNKDSLDIHVVVTCRKDIWPMKLFQYGSILFPKGQENESVLWYCPNACKGDGKSVSVIL